jgi:hypothetical protein
VPPLDFGDRLGLRGNAQQRGCNECARDAKCADLLILLNEC